MLPYAGAISIARRLQDPLAELVKLDPKSIGVGQYQHDVSQFKLGQSLNTVVEDCVNAVGVDVNMASAALLKQVSGLSASIATNIVAYRDQHGEFKNRRELKAVPRFGEKVSNKRLVSYVSLMAKILSMPQPFTLSPIASLKRFKQPARKK